MAKTSKTRTRKGAKKKSAKKKRVKKNTRKKAAAAKKRRKAAARKKSKPVARKKLGAKKAPTGKKIGAPPPQGFLAKIEGAFTAVVDTLTNAERLHQKLDPGVSREPE